MSTLLVTRPTLLDHRKRMDPDGKIAKIVEGLVQRNEVLLDLPYIEGNLPTGHQTTTRTGLPSVFWRLANRGIPSSKSRTAQITEACGQMEARGEIDVKIADLNGNRAAYRVSEQGPFMEALAQEKATNLFYGNSSVSPEKFNGLSVRFSSLSAANGENIVPGGSSDTDNTSIWLVCWGPDTITGIYPKGSELGIKHQDLGEGDAFDADGNRFRALMDLWTWECGIALRDWRFVVRIPNIEVSALVANTAPADLTLLMTKALHKLPSPAAGRCAFYCNRTVVTYLDIQRQAAVKGGGGLNYENVDGKNTLTFRGIPIRTVDAIVNDEALVS